MRRTVVGVVVCGFVVVGCAANPPAPRVTRWCEHGETDRRVDDSFCVDGVRGFEWEPDGDDGPGYGTVRTTTGMRVSVTPTWPTGTVTPSMSRRVAQNGSQGTRSVVRTSR